jgi:metal-responsive CopG/Arc/MetJ family transcriptional regulator
MVEMGRISVNIPDELEKKLRFKTIDRFGGKKGDLSRAVEEAVKTWVAKEKLE